MFILLFDFYQHNIIALDSRLFTALIQTRKQPLFPRAFHRRGVEQNGKNTVIVLIYVPRRMWVKVYTFCFILLMSISVSLLAIVWSVPPITASYYHL
jgi:hypothetical protein